MSNTRKQQAVGPAGWREGWGVALRVWVERSGRAVVGQENRQLLEGIDRCRSISAAARGLAIPYRRAWELVRGMNEAAGEPLVETTTGGVQGGGARLTALGHQVVAIFRDMQDQLQQAAAGLVPGVAVAEGRAALALHVFAAVSLEEVIGQLLNDFAVREPDVRVRAVFGASDELADHLLAGSPGQLFLTADPRPLERLGAAGLLLPEAGVPLAENGLAAVALAGQGVGIRRAADLLAGGDARVALAGPDCPLGRYTRAYLEGQRLYEPLWLRAVRVESSRAVLAAVRGGQAHVGLVYASDAASSGWCRTLFRVRRPPVRITYSGHVLGRGPGAAPARRLLDFLASSQASSRFRQCGFLPARAHS